MNKADTGTSFAAAVLFGFILTVGLAGCAGTAARQPSPAGSTTASPSPSAAAGREIPAQPTRDKPAPAPATSSDKPSAPQAAPAEPPAIVIRQMEIYGSITFRAGKALGVRSLVMTREEPPPVGSEGTVLRKVEIPGKPSEWIPIARVTLKKFDTAGQVHFSIVEELAQPPASAGHGTPAAAANPFAKGTNIKALMTL